MKKSFAIVLVVMLALVLGGCTTTSSVTNKTGWSDYAGIVVKDYKILGFVHLTSTYTTTVSPLCIQTTHSGTMITYDMLLQEAKKLGADDVINVRIDEKHDTAHSVFDNLTGYTDTRVYTGNALAIQYTTAVPNAKQSFGTGDSGMVTGAPDGSDGSIPSPASIMNSLFGR
jgi:uncharacterized protein YbjQ (UPF0145 family)